MHKPNFYLYTSVGCHLCEKAEHLLKIVLGEEYEKVMLVEISDSDDLLASYGLRIPVVGANSASGEWCELGWPFAVEELQDYLTALQH